MSKVELKIDDVTVYTSIVSPPGPGPTPTPTPTPTPPVPPPTTGALARYDSAPSASAKIIFLTDAEDTALQVAGRATANQMSNLRQFFFYNGWRSMLMTPRAGGGWTYTYDLQLPSGQWIRKIDTGTADSDNLVQPVPRAP